MTAISLLLISFTPGFFWLWFFVRLDKFRPEPRRLIALTFLLGCVSTIPAGLGNFLFGADALLEERAIVDPELISVVAAMLVVGPVEELCKFGAVWFKAYRSLYFDEPMDALVYAAAASLGFASLENLLYVLMYGPAVMLVRAPISTLAHLIFGSIWGQGLGRYYLSGGQSRLRLIGSLILAAGAHALFNVLVFTFAPLALALTLLGGVWSYRTFRREQRSSPFRNRRNYPQVQCENCGAWVRSLHQFCFACGMRRSSRRQVLICSHCNAANLPQASYCVQCGDRLLDRKS